MTEFATRLGSVVSDHYRIAREIGAGGMATVFLAHDLKHDRDVAIKVLHPELGAALGGERFLTEIRTTARLQHPHILPLLDSGGADGLLYYVMPLMEGETLRTRLARERQLPIDVALRIATEVGGALDYAHRHGVIHRDIKPENILLHDGRAVVADFGIALAVSAAGGSRMTQTGLSLGTPQYMSPEQAMGEKVIDGRADLYALGAVLYEMLTGEPPFSGATVQAIVAKVLTERPMHPTAVRDTIPPHVEATVLKALAKLPADRFATPAEFVEALARPEVTARFAPSTSSVATLAQPRASTLGRRLTSPAVAWGTAAASIALATWAFARGSSQTPDPRPVINALVPMLNGVTPTVIGGGNLFAISHDGSRVAYTGVDSANKVQLFVQRMDAPSITPVSGSDFANGAFFAPDDQSVGFFRSGRLWVSSLASGSSTSLGPALGARGAAWGSDGSIVYSSDGSLHVVRATGGPSVLVASPPTTQTVYRNPVFAGDRRLVVFDFVGDSGSGLAVVSLDDSAVTRLGIAGYRPAYLDGDVLAYVSSDGTLWAAPFDAAGRKISGEPRTVFNGVSVGGLNNPRIAMASNGTTLLMKGTGADERELVMVDRAGSVSVVGPGKRGYRYPRFSPDGRRLAFGLTGVRGPGSGDIWTLDLGPGTMLRITADSSSYHPEWAPDAKSIFHVKRPAIGALGLYRTPVDGTAPPSLVTERANGIWESRITPDGRTVVFREDGTTSMRDIYAMPVDSAQAIRPVVKTDFDEYGIALSPDGRWLAYTSNEAGTPEVYIRRLEPNSPRWRVTRSGGAEPRWAMTGELFFRNRDSMFVSRVVPGPEPKIGEPVGLFGGRYDASNYEPLWDVSPDARRFVMVRATGAAGAQLHLLLNWIDQWRAAKP